MSTFTNESRFLYKINDGSKKVLECHFNHDVYKCIEKYNNPSFINKLTGRYRTFKDDKIVKFYDAFVVLTNEDALLWGHLSNLHIIGNMVSTKDSIMSDLSNKRVIAVGRLDGQKKFDRLIKIWRKVCENVNDWHLDIFGQGPDEKMLNELISKYELNKSITIHKPSFRIFEEYAKSSIIAMTSAYEGWGLVLTEAMSCNIPCIAYRCKCGPSDIIKNGVNGFCIEENNEADFVDKLTLLIKNDSLRKEMGYKAYIDSQQYSIDSIMTKWLSLFNNLISKQKQIK